jgi:omega-3 fatty acid desaturase (delta-15 desaturase)
MPPCVVDAGNVEGKKAVSALQLNNLRKAIPEEAFKKSIPKSTWYMTFDFAMWAGAAYSMHLLCNSAMWATMPFWQQAIATLIYWNFAGIFMWTIFLIGHDCGHGTFSDYEALNDIVGHISHGSIFVPFYPWQVSIIN